MHDDDTPVGRLLTRREALLLLSASGAAVLTGSAFRCEPSSGSLPSCIARPRQTEGPYFVDEALNRADIRSDPATGEASIGVPLALAFLVSRISRGECEPLPGAQVDVWQCDAAGMYSGVRDRRFDTSERKFLRGYQVTDESGRAAFTTIYPGYYPGRAVHIHFKVRNPAGSDRAAEFTSQLYFDDALTDRIHTLSPYADAGGRRTRNAGDGIFRRGGEQLLLDLRAMQGGYEATFSLGLQLD